MEIKTEHRIGVNESNAHLAAALAGLGIIQTFTYALAPAIQNGLMVEILPAWRPATYPFMLFTRKTDTLRIACGFSLNGYLNVFLSG
ncbi:hypothetical protein O3W44_23590 [Pantoea sp. LMR881]|nr:hypothetical protein [Pantoea sp. LMR881]MCZ4061479.1 hypothetical protein [Pantoea sp. LMR881]